MVRAVKRKPGLPCFIAGSVMGLVVGIIGLSAVVSYRIEQYHQKIEKLELDLYDKNSRLTKLEDSINKSRYVLKNIQVFLIYEGELDRIAMEKAVKEKFQKLLGREIEEMDGELIADIIDKRVLSLNDHRYSVKVSMLVISETMKIWLKVEEVS